MGNRFVFIVEGGGGGGVFSFSLSQSKIFSSGVFSLSVSLSFNVHQALTSPRQLGQAPRFGVAATPRRAAAAAFSRGRVQGGLQGGDAGEVGVGGGGVHSKLGVAGGAARAGEEVARFDGVAGGCAEGKKGGACVVGGCKTPPPPGSCGACWMKAECPARSRTLSTRLLGLVGRRRKQRERRLGALQRGIPSTRDCALIDPPLPPPRVPFKRPPPAGASACASAQTTYASVWAGPAWGPRVVVPCAHLQRPSRSHPLSQTHRTSSSVGVAFRGATANTGASSRERARVRTGARRAGRRRRVGAMGRSISRSAHRVWRHFSFAVFARKLPFLFPPRPRPCHPDNAAHPR